MKQIIFSLVTLFALIAFNPAFNPALAADKTGSAACTTTCTSCAKTCEDALKYCEKKGGKHADKAMVTLEQVFYLK